MSNYPNLKAARDARRENALIEIAEHGFLIKRHVPANGQPYLMSHLPEGDGQPACGELIAPDGSDDPRRLPRQMPTLCPDCLTSTAGRTTPIKVLNEQIREAAAVLARKSPLVLH